MKTVLLLCALCLSLGAAGQVAPLPSLPTDSLTHKITYQGVVQVPGASQLELYSRAREWFAATFGSSKAVLEVDDRESGKLIGRAYAQFEFSGGFGPTVPWAMWRTIKVETKDGRYRYTITNFMLGNSVTSLNINPPTEPVEYWLAKFEKGKKPPGKMLAKMQASVVEGVRSTGEQEVLSLQRLMTPLATKSGW